MRYLSKDELNRLISQLIEQVEEAGHVFSSDPNKAITLKKKCVELLIKRQIYRYIFGVLYGDQTILPTILPKSCTNELSDIIEDLNGDFDGHLYFSASIDGFSKTDINLLSIQKTELTSGKQIDRIRRKTRLLQKKIKFKRHLFLTHKYTDNVVATVRKKTKFNKAERFKSLFQLKKLVSETIYLFMELTPLTEYQRSVDDGFVYWINNILAPKSTQKIRFTDSTERKLLRYAKEICKEQVKVALFSPNPKAEIVECFRNLRFTPLLSCDNPQIQYQWLLGHVFKDLERNGYFTVGIYNWYQVVKVAKNSEHYKLVDFIQSCDEKNDGKLGKIYLLNQAPLV